jgi:hypothetical protein
MNLNPVRQQEDGIATPKSSGSGNPMERERKVMIAWKPDATAARDEKRQEHECRPKCFYSTLNALT